MRPTIAAMKKKHEIQLEVAAINMLNKCIMNEHIIGTLQVGRFGQKIRQSNLRWHGNVK